MRRRKFRTVKTIDRSVILKAIRTENLGHQGWVDNSFARVRGNCTVCAVGGVLRSIGVPNHMIVKSASRVTLDANFSVSGADHLHGSPDKVDVNQSPLGALSAYFEGVLTRKNYRTSTVRKRLTAFVKENYPKRVVLDRPIRVPIGMKRVKVT